MSHGRLVIIGGGQSGLAAARAGRDRGWEPVVLEAGPEPAGSWPLYYDSLRLFSPRRFSSFPGYPFPGPPDGYPARDEVAGYLRDYAAWLGTEVRANTRVTDVIAHGDGFTATLVQGGTVIGDALLAATGSFANPHVPRIPGREDFPGRVLHAAGYRSPDAFAGDRVLVVGAGNSAVQIGYELARVAEVSLAVSGKIRFLPQSVAGRDLHWWLTLTRADRLPPVILNRIVTGSPVIDTGRYAAALRDGTLEQRCMFSAFTGDGVVWADGTRERVDAVIFATGYRPHLPYLRAPGILDASGAPRHRGGVSVRQRGLGFLGLEFQRSFSSNTLRGAHRDAGLVVDALTRQRRRADAG